MSGSGRLGVREGVLASQGLFGHWVQREADTIYRVTGTYSLHFLGLQSDGAEAVQRFKAVCIADLELSIEETQALLDPTQSTRVLLSSDSLPEISRISELLSSAGAQVSIVSALESSGAPAANEVEAELSFDLEDILSDAEPQFTKPREPKEYHLDLDEDQATLSDLGVLDTQVPNYSVPPTLANSDTEAPRKPAIDDLSTLAFDEDDSQSVASPSLFAASAHDANTLIEEPADPSAPESDTSLDLNLSFDEGASALVTEDPISQLVKDVSSDGMQRPWDDSDLSLSFAGDAPTDSELLFPEPSVEPARSTSAPSDEIAEQPDTSPPTTSTLNLDAALDAISFENLLEDASPSGEPLPPPFPDSTNVALPLESTAEVACKSDPPAAIRPGTASLGLASASTSNPAMVHSATAVSSSVEREPTAVSAQTSAPATTLQNLENEHRTEEESPKPAPSRSTSIKREGFSMPQLAGIFVVGLIILATGNWLLTPAPEEEATAPDLLQLSAAVPNTASQPQPVTTEQKATENNQRADSAKVGSVTSGVGTHKDERFEVSLSLSLQKNAATTKVTFTTPKPAELSLEEIANNASPRIWLKRAESDVVTLKQLSATQWSGSVPTYIFVERGEERRRLPGFTMVSVTVSPDGASAKITTDLSYVPNGDTALPAPGNVIEGVGKDLFRVAISAEFTASLSSH